MSDATEHVAGPLVELVQKCARCGEVLADYRKSAKLIPEGPVMGWMVGHRIVRFGGLLSDEDVGRSGFERTKCEAMK